MKGLKSFVSMVFLMVTCSIFYLPLMEAKTAQQPEKALDQGKAELVAPASPRSAQVDKENMLVSYARLALYFVKNTGQVDEKVRVLHQDIRPDALFYR